MDSCECLGTDLVREVTPTKSPHGGQNKDKKMTNFINLKLWNETSYLYSNPYANETVKDFNKLITFDSVAFELYGRKVWVPDVKAIRELLWKGTERPTLLRYCALSPLHHYTKAEHVADAVFNLTERVSENIRSRGLNGWND